MIILSSFSGDHYVDSKGIFRYEKNRYHWLSEYYKEYFNILGIPEEDQDAITWGWAGLESGYNVHKYGEYMIIDVPDDQIHISNYYIWANYIGYCTDYADTIDEVNKLHMDKVNKYIHRDFSNVRELIESCMLDLKDFETHKKDYLETQAIFKLNMNMVKYRTKDYDEALEKFRQLGGAVY